jgi:soluble lytic murein transglycosylase
VVFLRWHFVFGLMVVALSGFSIRVPRAAAQSSNSQSTPSSSNAPKTKAKSSAGKSAAKSSSTKAARTAAKTRRRSSPRLRRMRQAFVASTSLKPMARQLLQDRTPAAYAGVEGFARRHAGEDAGALAWLVAGYGHTLDHDYAKAIESLNRAKPHAGDLGDYVSYYLGSAYFQSAHNAEAIAVLADFDKTYPESLLNRDAHVLYANVLLSENRGQEAIPVLEKDRSPVRADLELALARAYAQGGDAGKAATILSNIYFTMPLSGEAAQADPELKKLPANVVPAPSYTARKQRADLLMKGRRYADAADEYRDLQNLADPSVRPALQLAMAGALRRAGKDKDAKNLLESLSAPTPELNAERLFNLGEIARGANDDDTFLNILGQLRENAPASTWLEQALLSAGNIYLLRRDYDRAIDSYRELQQRFPDAGRAPYAHWKVAWLSLRQGRKAEAEKGFEDQIGLYPTSAEVPAALYWRARLAEEDGDPAKARAFYQKLSQRFRNYYYGDLARRQLAKLPAEGENDGSPGQYAVLDRVPAISSNAKISADPLPGDNLRVQKSQLLENGALLDFAVRELQAAPNEDPDDKDNTSNWVTAETARLYEDAGRYDAAIDVLKRAVPNYFALDLPSLPRPYWEALFPKPYWLDLRKFSSANALDPYFVASLIRQESAFNPNAVSRANAVGLMQLLPKNGKLVAREVKLKHFAPTQLFTPATNMQLGTRYVRGMVDKYGSFEYALAAYNAGSDRVDEWLSLGKYRDPQEFVESIPFTETREYVQAIMRNANVYRQLYGTP